MLLLFLSNLKNVYAVDSTTVLSAVKKNCDFLNNNISSTTLDNIFRSILLETYCIWSFLYGSKNLHVLSGVVSFKDIPSCNCCITDFNELETFNSNNYLFETKKKLLKKVVNNIKLESNLKCRFTFLLELLNLTENETLETFVFYYLEYVQKKHDENFKTLSNSSVENLEVIKLQAFFQKISKVEEGKYPKKFTLILIFFIKYKFNDLYYNAFRKFVTFFEEKKFNIVYDYSDRTIKKIVFPNQSYNNLEVIVNNNTNHLNLLNKYIKVRNNDLDIRSKSKPWSNHEFIRLIYGMCRFNVSKTKKIYNSNILFFKYNRLYDSVKNAIYNIVKPCYSKKRILENITNIINYDPLSFSLTERIIYFKECNNEVELTDEEINCLKLLIEEEKYIFENFPTQNIYNNLSEIFKIDIPHNLEYYLNIKQETLNTPFIQSTVENTFINNENDLQISLDYYNNDSGTPDYFDTVPSDNFLFNDFQQNNEFDLNIENDYDNTLNMCDDDSDNNINENIVPIVTNIQPFEFITPINEKYYSIEFIREKFSSNYFTPAEYLRKLTKAKRLITSDLISYLEYMVSKNLLKKKSSDRKYKFKCDFMYALL